MARRSETRSKMVTTAARLFQRQGYSTTGWRQVVSESNTPWGSQSHHFPGGKEELAVEAISQSGNRYEQLLRAAFDRGDPAAAVELWASAAAAQLASSDWSEGCPVATVALELAHTSDLIGDACADAFRSWRRVLTESLIGAGLADERADRTALVVLAAFEGALLISRAERDAGPLHAVGQEMSVWIASLRNSQP